MAIARKRGHRGNRYPRSDDDSEDLFDGGHAHLDLVPAVLPHAFHALLDSNLLDVRGRGRFDRQLLYLGAYFHYLDERNAALVAGAAAAPAAAWVRPVEDYLFALLSLKLEPVQ